MLAIVQFTAPVLLLGLGVAALPVVIHLLLRPRPRRVWFPPVTFLHLVLASGQRAQRVRNLWLLLLRALLLGCVAVLLAGPTCTPLAPAPRVEGPVACALVVDDSWSMQYQLAPGTTVLDRARTAAITLIRTAADWPQPSAFALIWADPDQPVTRLTTDHALPRARLREAQAPTDHAVPLNLALRQAAGLLREARQPVRRLVVFTDQAAHAWRDVPPGLLTGIDNLTVSVRSVAPPQRTNVALVAAGGPRGLHPDTAPVPIDVTLNATGLDANCTLLVREAQQVVERIGPLVVPADGTCDVSLLLPPRPQGAHAVTLEVEPGDRLDFDQRRYLTFQTTTPPVVWLLTPADRPPDADLTALLLRNLLAPETLEPRQQVVAFRHLVPAELAEPDAADRLARKPDLIVITGGAELNEVARQELRRAAEGGATVLLLPGSHEDAVEWPGLRRLLARAVQAVETLPAVTSLAWEPESTFVERGEELDELTRTAIRRRVVLAGLQDGVAVEARYADGLPAIVSLRRGRGRLMLLTTSPDPQWSELGRQAAGLLTWLHELLRQARGAADAVAEFTAGESSSHSFTGLPTRGVARVSCLSGQRVEPISVRLSDAEPTASWPTDQPGIYTIETGRDVVANILYSVNWPASESDLRPITSDRLEALLGVAHVSVEGVDATDSGAQSMWPSWLTGLRDAAKVLPLVLLALVLGELLLASRMRRATVED